MTTDYRPISCDLHSQYELLAMRRARVSLDLDTSEGAATSLQCRVVDVLTRAGAEYLAVVTTDGEHRELRLDRLRAVTPLE